MLSSQQFGHLFKGGAAVSAARLGQPLPNMAFLSWVVSALVPWSEHVQMPNAFGGHHGKMHSSVTTQYLCLIHK